ncbi:MAG: hypothetical protein MZU97_01215 [Bacillus subtilis]|nr:hypothetical protein [Bacillus subtilis]
MPITTTTTLPITTTTTLPPPLMDSLRTHIVGQSDLSISVQWNGNAYVAVLGHGIAPANVAVDGTSITISATYLDALQEGDYQFQLQAGNYSIPFTIRVELDRTPVLAWHSNAVHQLTTLTDQVIDIDIKGLTISRVLINGSEIEPTRYLIEGSLFTLPAALLNTLTPRLLNTISVQTSGGIASLTFTTNDLPGLADKVDFIKYPGEAVVNEDFRGLVSDQLGSLTYRFELLTGDGVFTDHQNGRFSFVPATIHAGIVTFSMTVSDTYGGTTSKTYTLEYKTVHPSIIPTQSFLLGSSSGLEIPLSLRGSEQGEFAVDFVSLTGNGILTTDYVYQANPSRLMISADYLNQLALGDHAFLVTSTAGERAFTIRILDHPTLSLQNPSNVVNAGEWIPLVYTVDFKGSAPIGLFVLGQPLNSELYVIASEPEPTLTLSSQLLALLPVGSSTLRLQTAAGIRDFIVVVNDVPLITPKLDFIKLPGEAVVNEDFRGLVQNAVGTLTYQINLKTGSGTFTDHQNGRFSFTQEAVRSEVLVLTLSVVDQYGLAASRDIELTYKTVNPIVYDAIGQKIVDKINAFGDVVMTVDTFGVESSSLYYSMIDVSLLGQSIGSSHWVFNVGGNNRMFSIKAAYLRSLPVGIHTFTLTTQAGSANFTIEVKDSRPVTADQALYIVRQIPEVGDLAIAIQPYEHVLTPASFTIEGIGFAFSVDYDFINNSLILREAFLLTGLTPGDYTVLVDLNPLFVLRLLAPSVPVVDPAKKTLTLVKSAMIDDVVVNCQFFGLEAESAIKVGNVTLQPAQVIVANDQITLKLAFRKPLRMEAIRWKSATPTGSKRLPCA